MIEDGLEKQSLPPSALLCIVHDNGKNVVSGASKVYLPATPNNLKYKRFQLRCVAHTLHLCVQHAINSKAQPEIAALVEQCRNFVSLMHRAAFLHEQLSFFCNKEEISIKRIAQEVPTRWTSLFRMLQCLVVMQPALMALKQRLELRHAKYAEAASAAEIANTSGGITMNDVPRGRVSQSDMNDSNFKYLLFLPRASQFQTIKHLLTLLKPFNELTVSSQADLRPTIPATWAMLMKMRRIFQSLDFPFRTDSSLGAQRVAALEDVAKDLHNELERRFFAVIPVVVRAACFLDPVVKELLRRNFSSEYESFRDAFRQEVKAVAMVPQVAFQSGSNASSLPVHTGAVGHVLSTAASAQSLLASTFDSLFQSPPIQEPDNNSLLDIASEMAYYESVTMDHDALRNMSSFEYNSLVVWSKLSVTLPKLSVIARIFLAMPATSASAERVFSSVNNIVTDRRARLAPRTTGALVAKRELLLSTVAKTQAAFHEQRVKRVKAAMETIHNTVVSDHVADPVIVLSASTATTSATTGMTVDAPADGAGASIEGHDYELNLAREELPLLPPLWFTSDITEEINRDQQVEDGNDLEGTMERVLRVAEEWEAEEQEEDDEMFL